MTVEHGTQGALTGRERIRAVFRGEQSAVPPVSMRMDLWHRHAERLGCLPPEVRGRGVEAIEDGLGFCRSARYRTHVRFEFPEPWITTDMVREEVTTVYSFPRATLRKVTRRTREQALAGMAGHVIRHPVGSEEDCRAYIHALEQGSLAADLDGFDGYDREVGGAGLPLLILGPCPAHFVMLELMGYEGFYLAWADFPDTVNALVGAIEQRFRTELWPRALASRAELILHGTHFSDLMTPRPIFQHCFLPYLADFISRAHAAGKRVLWHADAGMGTLLDLVLEAGFDGADCLATAPLVAESLEDYDRAWKGRIVCWGGIPGMVLNPEYPRKLFLDHVRWLRQYTSNRPGFIIGASDNVMPGAEWERIVTVSDLFVPA